MRLTLNSTTPLLLATIRNPGTIMLKVVSGTLRVSRQGQDLFDGGGLPITASDNLVVIPSWSGGLYGAGTAVVDVVFPS